jgi:hypothetical protein
MTTKSIETTKSSQGFLEIVLTGFETDASGNFTNAITKKNLYVKCR